MILEREQYLSKIRKFYDTDRIKIIAGMRGSGKTTLLHQIQEDLMKRKKETTRENMLAVPLEKEEFRHLHKSDAMIEYVQKFVRNHAGKVYIFIDEVHLLKDWAALLVYMQDTLNVDIYAAGSNTGALQNGMNSADSSRFRLFSVYPFSFAEFAELYKPENPDSQDSQDICKIFESYLNTGGLPFLHFLTDDAESRSQYLETVYSCILFQDILKIYPIRSPSLLDLLYRYFSLHPKSGCRFHAISADLKNNGCTADRDTVTAYIKYGLDASLLYLVPVRNIPDRSLLKRHEKVYFADHGILQVLAGEQINIDQYTLETIVFMEAIRRGYDVSIGSIRNHEISFILEKNNSGILVQVQNAGEFSILEKIPDSWNKYHKFIVSTDLAEYSRNGIMHKNIASFLLEDWP